MLCWVTLTPTMEPELSFTCAWPAFKHSTLAAAAAGGTWAVGVGVAQDGGGGAVQVGVHIQVARAQVALDQQLVLLRVAPAHHQVAAPRRASCLTIIFFHHYCWENLYVWVRAGASRHCPHISCRRCDIS